jgi:hypothetical protein
LVDDAEEIESTTMNIQPQKAELFKARIWEEIFIFDHEILEDFVLRFQVWLNHLVD